MFIELRTLQLPLVEGILGQHIETAAQLLEELCRKASLSAGVPERRITAARCEANLDALRIQGLRSVQMATSMMESAEEVAIVAALLFAEYELSDGRGVERALELLAHRSPEVRENARWGMRLAMRGEIEKYLRGVLVGNGSDYPSVAVMDVLSFHRVPMIFEPMEFSAEWAEDIAVLRVETLGRSPGTWKPQYLTAALSHASQRVREAALNASARSGMPSLREFCRSAIEATSPCGEAVAFLGVVGRATDAAVLQEAATVPELAQPSIVGLGRLGNPVSVPFLLGTLDRPELAEAAAVSIRYITGIDLPRILSIETLHCLSDDELERCEASAPLDISRAHDLWKANSSRFDRSKRWQWGQCVSEDPLGPVFEQLPLAIRYEVYLRQRALVPGTPDWELETWPWKEKHPGG